MIVSYIYYTPCRRISFIKPCGPVGEFLRLGEDDVRVESEIWGLDRECGRCGLGSVGDAGMLTLG